MVAHLELDVLILAVSCGVIVASAPHWTRLLMGVCPAGTDRRRLMAALCAEYMLKFRADGDLSAD